MSEAAVLSPFGGPYSVERLTRSVDDGGYGLGGVALAIREKCMASPLFLATEILSTMWQANLFTRPSSAHREVEQAIIDQANLLYVDARGTGKTTLVDEVGAVWQLLRYPNDSMVMIQATTMQAKAISQQVRSQFVRNKSLHGIFPEYAMLTTEQQGDVYSWNVPCRTILTREGSFEVATPGMMRTGSHYDVVLGSDLMNPETTPPPCGRATIELMKAVIAVYSMSDGLLQKKSVNPRAHKRLDSNRWHDADLAAEIIRKDETNQWRKVTRGIKKGADGRWISTWPDVITHEELEAIYRSPSMTRATWAANFAGEPLPEGGMAFQEGWLHYHGGAKCPATNCGKTHETPKKMTIAITVDPAFSDSKTDKKKTDRSAMAVTGVAADLMLYVLDVKAGHWSPNEFVEMLTNLVSFWRPQWVGMEDTGGSRGLEAMFFAEMQRMGRRVPYRRLKPAGARKDSRIVPLHNMAEHGWLYFLPQHREAIDELVRFGVAERDDIADTLAYRALDIFGHPSAAAEQTTKKRTADPTDDRTADGFMNRMAEAAAAHRPGALSFLRGGRRSA